MRTFACNRTDPSGARRLAVSANSGGVVFGIGLLEILLIVLLLLGLGFMLRALLRHSTILDVVPLVMSGLTPAHQA